jgi:hypothetical protein
MIKHPKLVVKFVWNEPTTQIAMASSWKTTKNYQIARNQNKEMTNKLKSSWSKKIWTLQKESVGMNIKCKRHKIFITSPQSLESKSPQNWHKTLKQNLCKTNTNPWVKTSPKPWNQDQCYLTKLRITHGKLHIMNCKCT